MKSSKIKEQRLFKAFKSILLDTDIEKKIVYQEAGVYHLFGKYTIEKSSTGYTAVKLNYDTSESFSDLKHAVAWVTLDNLNRIADAQRIIVLDRQLIDTNVQVQVHQRMSKNSTDLDKYVLYKTKLQEDLNKRARILAELSGFVEHTKNWQYKTFREAAK